MNHYRNAGRVIAETPPDANCFVGFHDIIPWSEDQSCLAIHRADPEFTAMGDCGRPIDICLWRPETKTIEAVDSTTAWNFQQGARLQWLPGQPDTFAFNTVESGRPVAILRSSKTGERRVLDAPIYAISSDGKTSLAPNFLTLAHRWKAYGYPALLGSPAPTNQDRDGLWQLNLETGEGSLFISTQRAASFEAPETVDGSSHFLCHPSFSPDGSRVVFLHRFFIADGSSFTRMILTDRNADNLVLLAQEKVSHFDWIDNNTLLVWARFAGGGLAQMRSRGLFSSPWLKPMVLVARRFKGRMKKRLLSEAYYKISLDAPKNRVRYGWPALDSDGHPMIGRSHRWLVTDTYPDTSGNVSVILYHQDRNQRVDVHVFVHMPRTNDSDVKCDLHPRWDRTERLIAVDTCEAGRRQVRILDVHDIVA